MDIKYAINQLKQNQTVFKGLLQNKLPEESLWRPEEGKWCLLEIACHLLDEEQKDFKARIQYIFEQPEYDLPSINPVAWIKEHDYMSKNYEEVVATFLDERQQSVTWLKGQIDANWEQKLKHPKLGEMSAKLFLANWLAHDYLHIRQILRLQYNFLKSHSRLNLDYAGNW
ncbi:MULTISPECIES: DinB family protein [Aestuariivivens]|uniref:DinB family protein n=1 Tax=Aestuariivivens TaxID=1820275 RepID=UPI001CBF50EA|nr:MULTISPECIES: DinB family protein [Aestuariivivens]